MNKLLFIEGFQLKTLAKLFCAGSLKSIYKACISLEIMRFTWIYETVNISAYVDLRVNGMSLKPYKLIYLSYCIVLCIRCVI